MPFQKSEQLNILTCQTCKIIGYINWRKCPACKAMQMGYLQRNKWLYWGYALTREHLLLERGRRVLESIRSITSFVTGFTSLIWLGFLFYSSGLYLDLPKGPGYWPEIYSNLTPSIIVLFWVCVISFMYLWYRGVKQKDYMGRVERYEYNFQKKPEKKLEINKWEDVKKIKRSKKRKISKAFTKEAMAVVGMAYELADKSNHAEVKPIHLFYSLLNFNRISNIFIRLGISAGTIQKQLEPLFLTDEENKVEQKIEPAISIGSQQALFQAYESAYQSHLEYVSITELLVASTRMSEPIQDLLFDLGIDKQKLANVVEWARIRERLHHQYVKFRRAAGHRSKKGMDKAMTAVATPFLNRFSDDMTLLAQLGYLNTCVARDKEWEELFRVVEGGRQNVILVGEHGVGKRTIIEGLAQKMVEDDVPARLKDRRLIRLSTSSLLAGTTPAGAVERLQRIMNEIGRAGNIILYIHNIHELIGVSAGQGKGSLDVSDTLSEYLASGRFLTLVDTTNEFYSQLISNSALSSVFTKVEIEEMDQNQAIQALESKVGALEYKHKVFFSYHALEKAVRLSEKFLHESCLPGSALEIMTESASLARNQKGMNSMVTADEIAKIVAEKTNIPLTAVSSDESEKLLRLEEEMHKRIIGQDEAVDSVSNALRRARVQIRATNRPIANFLFLGPTGVGKTELAKTIADIYFGGEQRMIRLDMSEYQNKSGVERLLGRAGEKGTGILTEAVRHDPFSLLLLDEIEKADPDILNLFLQVMDDGRLTDSTGRVVDFTNIILIATSNASTVYVQEQIRAGTSSEIIKEKLLHGQLNQNFRPEFLNRFDGVVLFKALELDDIKKIAGLMLKRVAKDLESKGIEMRVEEPALEFLAQAGFDPEFGARPMRRVLQDRIENKLAELLLSGKLKRRETIVIGEKGKLRVEQV
ncbi:MAG: ATP-dependent Clp protease ATP-binding subunit [bacterium]